jgi:hypothetical protein
MATKLRQQTKHKQIKPDICLICNAICEALNLPKAEQNVNDEQSLVNHISSWLSIHPRENWEMSVPEKFLKQISDELFLRNQAKIETVEDAI